MITENLSTLKIHKLTQEQYERELEAGRIDENALYLTPDEEADLSLYATQEYVNDALAEKQPIGDYALKSDISAAVNTALAQAKASGEFNGKDGISAIHSWSGTVLTVTSASGTSSADLKGDPGEPGVDGADYILTDADKTEIAEMAAELVEIPDSSQNVNHTEPAEDDIPRVFFGGVLPQTKDDIIMSFRYMSKTADIKGYCKTKAQGNGSMSYPKKNQTVKLYKDADCTEKMKVNFKGWGKQNKFCFKANWIDLTHARNIVSARLWGDVVKSRENYDAIPELLRTSPNQGAIDGFPVKVFANGVYQGRYTLNIPKDAWMANMDDELDTHCILSGENHISGNFRAPAVFDETDWEDELHDTVPESIKTRWNEIISFVMNSTDEQFVANIDQYFDVQSLIDYYLFALATCGLDSFGRNQLFMTYDGQKWFATMYDMDSTFGMFWDGAKFVPSFFDRGFYEDIKTGSGEGCLLYIRLKQLFFNGIIERWNELRMSALSIENIVNHFERFVDICPPHIVEEDYADTTANGEFSEIPMKEEVNNIQQIRNFANTRLEYVDKYLSMDISWTDGARFNISDSTGEVIGGDCFVSDMIPIEKGCSYRISAEHGGYLRAARYTADGSFIDYSQVGCFDSPEWSDVENVRIGVYVNQGGGDEYLFDITKACINNVGTWSEYTYNISGNGDPIKGIGCLDIITLYKTYVQPGEVYKIETVNDGIGNFNYLGFVVYASDGTRIGLYEGSSGYQCTMPDNAAYFIGKAYRSDGINGPCGDGNIIISKVE